jgi:type I restriction enzyme R subunit
VQSLNPALPTTAIEAAIDELTRDRSAMLPVSANREIYELLKEGVQVSLPDLRTGGQKTERVRVVDWQNPAANDFVLVSQMSITGALYTRRPDLIGFVNGLPLVVIELKKPAVPAQAAFDDNLNTYKTDIPSLFWYNALLIASNGTDSRIGSLTADWGRFFEWKRIEREDEPPHISLEVALRGTCQPLRLLDIVENFTLFSEHKIRLIKILAQNHQFIGVNNAINAAMGARSQGSHKGGVFWQTQGSGKSFSMVFFAQKILRKVVGNWSFVIVTDRKELDDQIAKTFAACGVVADATACHAASGAHLKELLRGNNRYVFTLIHKFQTSEELCDRRDVVVMTDEAHRSQYDTLALNMRAALPKALFLAFTGTPLITGEERTRELFGDYVSIYNFQQSVEDGATVPLFYENRTPELQLVNPELNDDIYDAIEAADLDEAQEEQLQEELSRQYHILTREDRLETIARDIVSHFLGRGFQGKAMVVSIDKATALRMINKVSKHWALEAARIENELLNDALDEGERIQLKVQQETLQTTDMALIVSAAQNEIAHMAALGLDIAPHRKRMNEEALDEKFKDPNDPLRLVFVCAMWLTGFDAPSCSTLYLDKPLRNHTLMQTIARANRVYPGKHSGLIVDYANVFASLEKALAVYGAGAGNATPVRDKAELVRELTISLEAASSFCTIRGVNLSLIEAAASGSLQRLQLLGAAVNALISPDQVRKDYQFHERLVTTLFKAVKPDLAALPFVGQVAVLVAIADIIRAKTQPGHADISVVMADINAVLDVSITGVTIGTALPIIDLSKIDFEALRGRFDKSTQKNTDIEVLKAAIRAQMNRMIGVNKMRMDFQDKFEELIKNYNAGSQSIEQLFEDLLLLTKTLTVEEERHLRENLSEQELVIFDILTRPAPALSPQERDEVKKVARDLLATIEGELVIAWRQRPASRSRVKLTIEDVLDDGLPSTYDPTTYKEKCRNVFEHIYENYAGWI